LKIYDIAGRLVYSAPVRGNGEFVWEGIEQDGKSVSTGIYFYRIAGNTESVARRMIVVK